MIELLGQRDAQRARIQKVIDEVCAGAQQTSLIFITNLRSGPVIDVAPTGIINTAQYYSEAKADAIIRTFQDVGFHVLSFFSETAFMKAALDGSLNAQMKEKRVVFTSAEGGQGSGRRALIPSFCRLLGLPVCNSGPHGCSVARHKYHASMILRQAGLPVPQTWLLHAERGWIGGTGPPAGLRVIVKPTYESASIGVDETSVRDVDPSFPAYAEMQARRFGQPATVQEFIAGREFGIPIIELDESEALPVMEYVMDGATRFLEKPRTFTQENVEERVGTIPAESVSDKQLAQMADIAVAAFKVLEMGATGRMDVRLDVQGRPWIFDTNESPPPIANTCYARSLETLGFDTAGMLALWVGAAMRRDGFGRRAEV
jgi:D-alanine-D-alanine ligase